MCVQNECRDWADWGHLVAGASICHAKIWVPHRRKAALSPFCEFDFLAARAHGRLDTAYAENYTLPRGVNAAICRRCGKG